MRLSRYLAEDERVVLAARRHPAVLVRPALIAVVTIALAAAVGLVVSPDNSTDLVDTLVGAVAVLGVLRLCWRAAQWRTDRIFVTDRRVIEISGALIRRVGSIPLARLGDTTYRRSIAGRLLGYGDLVIESSPGGLAAREISRIARPDDFYRTLSSLLVSSHRPLLEDDDTGPLPRVVV
jgi:uncharacterized membrane protein YdbT with pleckstrin-like domain